MSRWEIFSKRQRDMQWVHRPRGRENLCSDNSQLETKCYLLYYLLWASDSDTKSVQQKYGWSLEVKIQLSWEFFLVDVENWWEMFFAEDELKDSIIVTVLEMSIGGRCMSELWKVDSVWESRKWGRDHWTGSWDLVSLSGSKTEFSLIFTVSGLEWCFDTGNPSST